MPKRLIFIFSALAVAMGYLFFVEPHLKSTTEKLLSKNELWAFPQGSLSEISFRDIRLRRGKNGVLRVEKPVAAPASEEACAPLFMKWERVVAVNTLPDWAKDGKKLSDFGLDPPVLTVKLKAGEQAQTLLLGKKVEGQLSEHYAKLEGQSALILLRSDLVDALQKPAAEYADSKPFAFLKDGPCEIHWRTENHLPCVLKRVSGLFVATNDTFVWQADNHLSRAFILELQNFDVTKVAGVKMSDEEAGLEKPWCSLAVSNPKYTKEMLVGKTVERKKSRWVKFEPNGLAFPLEENILKYLDLDFEGLAAKNPMDGPVTFLSQVTFDFHEKKTQLVFAGEKTDWHLEHPYSWLFPSPKVFNYLLKFVTRDLSRFRMGNLSDPALTVLFEYKDPSMPREKVEIFRVKDNPAVCYVQRNGVPTLAEMPASILEAFSDDPFQFVAKNALELALEKSSKLLIQKEGQEFSLQKSNLGAWSGTTPKDLTVDALLDGLRKAECYSSMLKKDGVDFGFAAPLCQLTFFGEDGKPLLDCKVGSYSSKSEAFLLADGLFFMFVRQLPDAWISKTTLKKEN